MNEVDYTGRFGLIIPQEHRVCFDDWKRARDEAYVQSRTAGGDALGPWRRFEIAWSSERRHQLGITDAALKSWEDEFGY